MRTDTSSFPTEALRACHAVASRTGAAPAALVRAPGRVNLIGGHTDYNGGHVLPLAIDRALWIAASPRTDGRLVVDCLDTGEEHSLSVRDPVASEGTAAYLAGVASLVGGSGWTGAIAGDIPLGAGLSSSSALLVAALMASEVAALAGAPRRSAKDLALLSQQVEQQWAGVDSGIMDPLIIAAARENEAALIDCRSRSLRHLPIPASGAVAVLDTRTRRDLADSSYNERRGECRRAAEALGVASLCDLGVGELEAREGALEPLAYRRARHVVGENERTLGAARALRAGDLAAVGALMSASHRSLRDDFQVSSAALDTIVEIAAEHPACFGARMTGAGFGGCAVALIDSGASDMFVKAVADRYEERCGQLPLVHVCRPARGASMEPAPVCV